VFVTNDGGGSAVFIDVDGVDGVNDASHKVLTLQGVPRLNENELFANGNLLV
jgi:hypothetical protein